MGGSNRLCNEWAGVMRRCGLLVALIASVALAAACAEPVKDIDRTQANVLSKSLFDGTWYFARTTVDSPFETSVTFVGDRQDGFGGLLRGSEDFPASKIRWRIEEDLLLACRVDEIVVGSTGTTNPGELAHETPEEAPPASGKIPCDHPIAAFAILSHFDIIRDYNAATGEQNNVISENTSDREWHERDYLRVDWTDLGLSDFEGSIGLFGDLFGEWNLEAPYYVQAEAGDCRRQTEQGVDYSACPEGFLPPVIEPDSILITNRVTISSLYRDCVDGTCSPNEIGMRLSFRKVPERPADEAYLPKYYPDPMFERFGIWRVIKNTYTPGRGQTDFKQYLGTAWKLFKKTQYGDPLRPIKPSNQRADNLEGIVYYLNRDFPVDLKPAAFRLAKGWNDAFDGVVPDADITKACQVVCAEGKPMSECAATDENWRMEGPCAFELRENSGSEFMGDLRYNFIAFIQDPGRGQPCGVGGPANDPETGELINGTAYVYGAACFDYFEARILDMLDVLCAQHAGGDAPLPAACEAVDENAYLRGIRVLEIMRAQGYTQPPTTPIVPITPAGEHLTGERMVQKLEPLRARMEQLRINRGALHSRGDRLRRAGVERLMVTDDMLRDLTGGRVQSVADLTDEELAEFNFLAPQRGKLLGADQDPWLQKSARAIEPADFLFNDSALWAFAQANLDLDREQFQHLIREQSFTAVTLHELGHNLGLRHNFEGSFDRINYHPEYWRIMADTKAEFVEATGREVPEFTPFWDESSETREAYYERFTQWEADQKIFREMTFANGIKQYRYSSIMDYGALLYTDWNGLGAYDKAAMRFVYAGVVDRSTCLGTDAAKCATAPRERVPYYMGGELCATDADCPMADDGQRCRRDDELGQGLCSSWDREERASDRFNVRHLFCSDERVPDRPFCNRFDEGESSEEIVRSMIELYERNFIFNNFRRYRATGFDTSRYFQRIFQRYFTTIGDQMQTLLYKYFYERGFRSNDGPGGFMDMFRATVVGFDFLGNVLATPESGAYQWNELRGMYELLDRGLIENPSGDFINLPLGLGKPLYSTNEDGYFGQVRRISYMGVFYDKLAALLTLSLRDWGVTSFTNDERFLLSFYDFFPSAYIDVVGSVVAGTTHRTANHYEDGRVLQRTYWDGNFFGQEDGFDPRTQQTGRPIEPGASTILGLQALIYAAQFTPYYLDISFMNAMRVFEVGGETGFDISDIAEQDMVTYTSPNTHRTFVAVATEDVPSLAVRGVEQANDLKRQIADLEKAIEDEELPQGMSRGEAERELRSAESRLRRQEDTLANIVFIIDLLGIGAF